MSDELDALWPEWMVQKRNEIRVERSKRTTGEADEATRRKLEAECSDAELERQRAARASRKSPSDEAFYRPARFERKHAGSV